ncbi:uncharacterized protein [Nicotiana sylvestris]|uniref:uncharacterized protein n=1 Tax=Nicotiana sylvestris TaxID=4096 RepID=UPI00388CEBC0
MDRKVRDVSYIIEEQVLLRVLPMKRVMRFEKKRKLSPSFIGLFEILTSVREVSYELVLSPSLTGVHLVFHVSMLRKYHGDPSHVLDSVQSSWTRIYLLLRSPLAKLDMQVRKLWSKNIALVIVQWQGQSIEDE